MSQPDNHLYEKNRHLFDTGDIVLFSSKGLIGRGIKISTQSEYSHVGMIVRLPGYDINLLWESTTLSKSKDIYTGESHRGVALVMLSDRIRTTRGKVAIRRLQAEKGADQISRLGNLRKELRGVPYERSYWQLFRSSLSLFGNNRKEDLSSVFCSEAVAEAYQRAGWLSDERPSNSYVPGHFSEKHSDQLPLINGARLGPEIVVREK